MSSTTTASSSITRPAGDGSAQDDLRHGLLPTQVSRPVAWTMIIIFVAILFGLPITQAIVEWRRGQTPGALALAQLDHVPTRSDLRQFEDSLSEQSIAIRHAQPTVQQWLTCLGGAGSKEVVVGQGGWLFYRPGIDSITGPGFLDPETLGRRAHNLRNVEAGAEKVSPDPRPAILQFKQQLESRGIRLILLPIPDKASLQPSQLSPAIGAIAPPQNASYKQFIAEMRSAGVDVIDISPPIVHPDAIRYLKDDTHWTPQFMDDVARQIGRQLDKLLPDRPRAELASTRESLTAPGDLAEKLRLPADQTLFPPQSITIDRVADLSHPSSAQYRTQDSALPSQSTIRNPRSTQDSALRTQHFSPLRPDPASPILLLGDSFTNIYSAKQMGFGQSAGLAERLCFHLRHRIDWLARNDAGAHATREMLQAQQQQRRDRLAGKRIVIWQFAARELSLGDWKLLTADPKRGP